VKEAFANSPTTLKDYVAILGRRKWIIIILPVVAGLTAFVVSRQEAPLYQAKAEVLVNRSAGVVTAVTGVQDPATFDPERFLTTTAMVARSPELAVRVVRAAGVAGITPSALLGMSSVTSQQDADLLDVSVSYRNPGDAVLLANAYAREFTRYKTEVDTARVNDALRVLHARIADLQAQGASSQSYQTLTQYQGQLETIGRLLADNTSVLQPAEGAGKVSPRPRRDLLVGALLGFLVGLGIAFLAEALDRRVRTSEDISAVLGLPLLGRVPRPPRQLRKANELVMLREPVGAAAEAFRKLRASLELANRERGARTIMFTSAEQREGKSTTVANLAIALARGGRRVALVDLDVRRPFLHVFFRLNDEHGFADVVLDEASVAEAMQEVAVPMDLASRNDRRPAIASNSSNGRVEAESILHILPCGAIPPADPEFLARGQVSAALEELAEAFDIVLVDAPPLLAVADAMSLSTRVDAVVIVTRVGAPRPLLEELGRQLENCQAATLGVIVTGAGAGTDYGYGFSYPAYSYTRSPTTGRARQPIEPRR
jgi:succinoglycan biosynthesis transport protein ExoP